MIISFSANITSFNICYVFFPTEGYGGNLNFEKNEKRIKKYDSKIRDTTFDSSTDILSLY